MKREGRRRRDDDDERTRKREKEKRGQKKVNGGSSTIRSHYIWLHDRFEFIQNEISLFLSKKDLVFCVDKIDLNTFLLRDSRLFFLS